MRILLVDDHVLFREGLSSLLGAQPNLDIVGAAKSVTEAIELAAALRPDLILMDFTLPDGTGADAAQAILSKQPDAKIVFLTVHEDDDRLFAALREGAKGYLLKNTPVEKLITYLHGVACGEAALSPKMTSRILAQFSKMGSKQTRQKTRSADLTTRELQIIKELDTGATNQEIADRLFISERTVKNHVSRILAKLKLRNRYEAANYARRHGLTRTSFDFQ
ncbi:MAG: response regulator transcription factor [Chloroflexi bacterium]|nr:response regulator transcription factor [Chloroflexota bacterium]